MHPVRCVQSLPRLEVLAATLERRSTCEKGGIFYACTFAIGRNDSVAWGKMHHCFFSHGTDVSRARALFLWDTGVVLRLPTGDLLCVGHPFLGCVIYLCP